MDKKPPTHTQQPQPTHPKMDKVPPTDTQQRAPRLGWEAGERQETVELGIPNKKTIHWASKDLVKL